MAAGIQKAVPDAVVDCCPIADGGEGTLAALTTAMSGHLHRAIVTGPLGDPIEAEFATFADGSLAVVESATAVGLQLVPDELRDPTKTSSRGVGELIVEACKAAPQRLVIAIGGSSTNDGGCGMAQALGIRFYDNDGDEIEQPLCGGMLSKLSRIDASGRSLLLRKTSLTVACDVQNRLTGPDGAAYVYAPQKGASEDQVPALDAGLRHLAGLIRRDLNTDIEDLPGSGAAGGLGGGLVAFAGARIASGIDTVLDAVEFEKRVRNCDLCITGEGQIDAQSVSGKACTGVARVALKHNVPTVALVGAAGPGAEQCLAAGLRDYVIIGEGLPAEVSMRQAAILVADAAGQLARDYLGSLTSR
jgi:glycerate kinase